MVVKYKERCKKNKQDKEDSKTDLQKLNHDCELIRSYLVKVKALSKKQISSKENLTFITKKTKPF